MSGEQSDKMGFNATWSMAVGGMVGGGIFSVLGVVIAVAGTWSWLSFVLAGLIALCAADSYSRLADTFDEGGGAFTFLRDVEHAEFAGSVSWIVIIGYTLTISVYAFTFGHYLGNVFELGSWFPKVAGVSLIVVLMVINLRGVGEAAIVEIVTVWGKLAVLVGLGAWGLWEWRPEMFTATSAPGGVTSALVGAAVVFMAYEGFQLLAYDYDDIIDAQKTVPRAMFAAIVAVIAVYLVVTFGTVMLVGSDTIVEYKEVALARAGQAVAGEIGLWVVTVAAVFSTASAINATLFAVGRLVLRVAEDGELPRFFEHENSESIPDRAIITIAGIAALLAVIGQLDLLVEAASLGFLLTFTVVNGLALYETSSRRVVSLVGMLGGAAAVVVLVQRQLEHNPMTLGIFLLLVVLATVGRHFLLRSSLVERDG